MYDNPDWQLAVRLQFGRFDLGLSNVEEGGTVRRVADFSKCVASLYRGCANGPAP